MGAIPLAASNATTKSSGHCGELAFSSRLPDAIRIVDPATGASRQAPAGDPLIGRWVDLFDSGPLDEVLFAPGGKSWVKGALASINGRTPELFQSVPDRDETRLYTPAFWSDASTLFLFGPGYGKLSRWNVLESEHPIEIAISVAGRNVMFGFVNGRPKVLLSGSPIVSYQSATQRQGKPELVDLETLESSPAFADDKVVADVTFFGSQIVRVVNTNTGGSSVQLRTNKGVKTLLKAKSRLQFGSSLRFNAEEGARAGLRYVALDANNFDPPKVDGRSWVVDLLTGKSFFFQHPTYGPNFDFDNAKWVQGVLVVPDKYSVAPRQVLFPTAKGTVAVALDDETFVASYGSACPGAFLGQRSDLPEPLVSGWTIRPVGATACIGVSSEGKLWIVRDPAAACLSSRVFLSGKNFVSKAFFSTLARVDSARLVEDSRGPLADIKNQCVRSSVLMIVACERSGEVQLPDDANWRRLDPIAGRGKYPNPQGTYPLWVELDGVAQCLTRSGDTDGSTVSMQPCGDVLPNQVWE
jgi:hypothetical protein